ncbi:MAG: PPC domain-containing protein [Pseudomonadales bacterium]|nr:PPC domain-containing protein [Pseudomonadales bacterium]
MKVLPFITGAILSLLIVSCVSPPPAVEFGDDSSDWAHNGECDDPRFSGPGSAEVLVQQDAYHDASDCRDLYQKGRIQLAASAGNASSARARRRNEDIDFGDDASDWAHDGECDDPRFSGPGVASKTVWADRFHDASDCRALYQRGAIELEDYASATRAGDGRTGTLARIIIDGIDFGDDSSSYALNDQCDDPRFSGEGSAEVLAEPDRFRDASDCSALYQSGQVQLMEDTHGAARLLQSGQIQRGQLADSFYPDRYSYQGNAGATIVINLQASDFDTYLTLVTPSGERLSNDDYGDDSGHSQLRRTLDETGEYQVEVAGYSTEESGAYTLKLSRATIVSDKSYDGALDSSDATSDKGEYVDTYTFTGKSGQFVTLELGSDDFDTFLVLRAPDGAVESNDDTACSYDTNCQSDYYQNSLIERELTLSGTYTVRVTSYSAGETGAYHLRIALSEASD